MKVVSVLNHKGGVGKSTIATNIAGFFANNGGKVMLGDFDVQQSSRNWLSLRPENAPPIQTWNIVDGQLSTPPEDITHIVVDSPAGIRGASLKKLVSISDKIVAPLKPGIFDMMSTQTFFDEISEIIVEQDKRIELCVIGNMVDARTRSADQLTKFINELELPLKGLFRNTQIYVHLANHGLTLFDAKNDAFSKDMDQWKDLIEWLNAD